MTTCSTWPNCIGHGRYCWTSCPESYAGTVEIIGEDDAREQWRAEILQSDWVQAYVADKIAEALNGNNDE
jgi:hypothetical protein